MVNKTNCLEKIVEKELDSVVNSIRQNSGYFLYLQDGNSPQYSDRKYGKIDYAREYMRAYHGLGDADELNKLLESIYISRLDKIMNHIEEDSCAKYDTNYFAVVSHGPAFKKDYKTVHSIKTRRKRGLLGKLLKKTEEITVSETKKFQKEIKLSDVGLKGDGNAYNTTLSIKGVYRDDIGRNGPVPPMINIITDKDATNKIVDYLKTNPENYYKLIEKMFPENEAPNVHKNIIKSRKNVYGLKFVNTENGQVSEANMVEKEYFTPEQLAEKQALSANPVFKAFLEIISTGKCSYAFNQGAYSRMPYNDGVPLEQIIEKLDKKEDIAKFPKALKLRALDYDTKVSLDSKLFGEYLYRSVNGADGRRADFANSKKTSEIIASYIEKGKIFSNGGGSGGGYGTRLTTTDNLYVSFSGDRHGKFITPRGHVIVMNKDGSDKVNKIKALGEVVLPEAPLDKVKFIYLHEECAQELKKKFGDQKVFGERTLDDVLRPHPWSDMHSLMGQGLPEVMVLSSKEMGLAEPRYNSLEEFNSAVEKTIDISKNLKHMPLNEENWEAVEVD
jgi:hypothetical protein